MHDTTEEKVLEVSEEQLTRAERSEQKFSKPESTPYFLTLLCSLAISLLSVVYKVRISMPAGP